MPLHCVVTSKKHSGGGSSAPPQAAAWGMNTLTFADEFTSISTIDTTNSKASGFKWYSSNFFGNPPVSSSAYSISGSILTFNNTANLGLCTLCNNGIGQTFSAAGGGFYIEFLMKINSSYAGASGVSGWPAVWSMSAGHLLGSISSNFPELDFIEMYPSSTVGAVWPLMAFHDWTTSSANNYNTNDFPTMPGGYDANAWHTYGTLYVPMARNGGTGIVERYVDNALLSTSVINFTASGPASPGATPSNPNGTFSCIDGDSQPVLLGNGTNWLGTELDFVHVWQVSAG